MQRRQWGVLIVLATVGAACAHVPPRTKPDKDQPLALDAGGKIYNWQAPPQTQRVRRTPQNWQAPFGRPFSQRYERLTPAGNPTESMESPLRQLSQPVPVVDAPLPVPPAPTQGRP